jgi:hypothetical protein
VTAGDNLWVSDDGRAELDVGPIQVWLAGGSNVYFEQFDDHSVIARLATGVLAVRIRQWEPKDALRITTPHGEVSFVRPGLYLVSAGDGHSPSTTTTRFGQSELTINGRVQWVSSGESFSFDRSGARFDRFAYGGNAWGAFESWVTARDRRIDRWEQRNRGRDINPWIIGVRDLDDHGYWDSHYEYGRVWYPRNVSYDWAPYRYGRWSWVQPWGWTWVDDAPWGFAPFHYGRWVRVGGRWAWCPGSYLGRAVYAPALVTFFGGSNWRVGTARMERTLCAVVHLHANLLAAGQPPVREELRRRSMASTRLRSRSRARRGDRCRRGRTGAGSPSRPVRASQHR